MGIDNELKDGEPCSHIGCLNHVTHPCEGCGRISGKKFINYQSRLSEAIEALEKIKSGKLGGLEMCREAMIVYAKDTLAKLKEG